MADRYVLQLRASLASNTGGPYTATWDRAVVPVSGTIRNVEAVASALASNARRNTVDIYVQSDAPAAGSNTGTTVLVSPITLVNNNDSVSGTIRESGARVSRGNQLHLRTDSATAGSTPSFIGLTASVEIERDPD